jgi:hypothetical protein
LASGLPVTLMVMIGILLSFGLARRAFDERDMVSS